MFGSLGFTELILILIIVMIIFGAGKLPNLGEGLGKAIKGFKQSVQEAEVPEGEPQEVPPPMQATVTPPPQEIHVSSQQAEISPAVAPAPLQGTPQPTVIPQGAPASTTKV